MLVFFSGLMLGLSLIMALGPQNIFLIRQGALRKHAVMSAVTCFFCDALLVTLSVFGLHELLQHHPDISTWMVWVGSAFLFYYGSHSLRNALRAPRNSLAIQAEQLSRYQIILLAVGFSLLNPHAIIDSLVLIGGGSSQFPEHPGLFLSGVIASSLIWFAALTFTAYFFSHTLTKNKVWRRIEFASGIVMIAIALQLLLR